MRDVAYEFRQNVMLHGVVCYALYMLGDEKQYPHDKGGATLSQLCQQAKAAAAVARQLARICV